MRFVHAQYMASEAWRQRRISYYMTHARRCRGCGSTEAIELHHLSYANVYHEPDDDLMPLCEGCHAYVHIWHRKIGGELARATTLALAEMRRPVTVVAAKPVGRHEPNAVLFAAIRDAQAHQPTISSKSAKKAGRALYRWLTRPEAQGAHAPEHAFQAKATDATRPHQRSAN